jgi:NodT family efflux transporter outer membrane factor (OMF) lipoprotein
LVAGCTVGPEFREPQAVADKTYLPQSLSATVPAQGPGGDAQRFVPAQSVGGAWWRAFGSQDLDRLVQQALDSSPTLAQARARLEQAREEYRARAGTTLPQVNGSLGVTREKINPAAFGGGLFGDRSVPPFTLYDASVNVSYALDLFGGNRRALEALAAQVDYQRYEADAARLTLAANVVTTAVRRASLAEQVDLAERIVALHARELEIAQQRYRAGGIAEADVISLRAQVEQSRAAIPPLRTQLAQAEHQLAIYLGSTPAQGAGRAPEMHDLTLPTELPLTLPASLARQRPDIQASAALLHQASANIGVATANLFPQINLSASLGANGTQLDHLVNVWSVAAGLTQPIFHGGELRARRRAAEDAYDAAAAAYRESVLHGLQQVADVLRALEQDAIELAARDRAQRDAQSAARIARMRYEAGGISLAALLDAQRQELQATLDRTRAQAQRLSDTAALYQALGAKP